MAEAGLPLRSGTAVHATSRARAKPKKFEATPWG